MLRRVDLYTIPGDPDCVEITKFLEGLDIKLNIRNVDTQPLGYGEIVALFRHFDMRHLLNVNSKRYKLEKFDASLPGRNEVYAMMAEDNDLIKKPIIVAGRLMVIGCNIEKIKEMLQIRPNGSDPAEEIESEARKTRRTVMKNRMSRSS
ncbi:MAG: hypothetical protein JSV44_00205 [Candidatus Zixiibacteriota bacterium]|nr:MAG: hypothetical protein JSV44_00205 [candidate division Zixibacteria bacterium]